MAPSILVDAGYVVALLSRRDTHHHWAVAAAERLPPPWKTCKSALSEAFHLLGIPGQPALSALLRRQAVICAFDLTENIDEVLKLIPKYQDAPMSFADACLVRMTEIFADPVLLTTNADFRVYRRHGRRTISCAIPT